MGSQLGGASAVKLEEIGGVKPALLPLFPPVPSSGMSYSPEWSELLDGGGRRAVAPRPVEKASMHDYYLGSLGYSSSEFALSKTRASRRDGMNFGSFSKVDGTGLAPDGNNAFGHRSS